MADVYVVDISWLFDTGTLYAYFLDTRKHDISRIQGGSRGIQTIRMQTSCEYHD